MEKRLRAGDRHRLRLAYDLALPPIKGSAKDGYLPGLHWGEGGRVNFNFGFTDLGGGRYLEAWAPANLIYDRFSLRLDVRIRHCLTPQPLARPLSRFLHVAVPDAAVASARYD